MTSEPRCVQRPHVPIWIGGTGKAPFRRVVEFGDGWAPMTGTFEERADDIAVLRDRVRTAGRDPDALAFVGSLTLGEPDETMRRMSRGHHSVARDRADAERRTARPADEAIQRIREHAQAGFTHLTVTQAWETPRDFIDNLEEFARDVLPAFRR
jgi:alkanesulfonate monooxygenase SsuD/methylene tetrahydromethanopterin reductase-like flavin-dependent oxidoreductase (luciferase family)